MTSQRILTSGGLLLFLMSALAGLHYDLILRPEQHMAVSYTLDMALNMAVKGDPTMAAAFAGEYASRSLILEIQSRLPLHLAFAGAAAIIPIWLTAKLDVSERMKQLLALLIVGGGLLLAAGDVLQIMGNRSLGQYVVLSGYASTLLGLSGFGLYAALFVWLQAAPPSRRKHLS